MAVRKRGDSWQVDVSYKGTRRSATESTKEAAKVTEGRLLLELREAPVAKAVAPCWTLQQAFDTTMQVAWRGKACELNMMRTADTIMAFFGADTTLDAISTTALDAYAAHLTQRGRKGATINRHLACMSKAMSVAHQRGGLASKPHTPRQKETAGRIRYLTIKEETQCLTLLGQWGKCDHHDAFIVLIDTGMRCGELWRLEERDIDFDTGMISIWQNKADQPRSIPMTSHVRNIMQLRLADGHTGKLFPYNGGWLRNQWERMRDIVAPDDDQFVPHALRHTCASRLVQRGATIPVVQMWLGHKTIQMTMRYSHLAPQNLTDAAKLLEREAA